MFVYIKSKHGDYKSVCWVSFSVSKVRDISTSGASLSPKSLKSGYLRGLHRNVKYFPSMNSAQWSVSQNFSKNSNPDTVFIAFLNFGPSFLSDRKILQMISGVSISLSNVADPGNGLSSISVRIWEYHLPSFESWPIDFLPESFPASCASPAHPFVLCIYLLQAWHLWHGNELSFGSSKLLFFMFKQISCSSLMFFLSVLRSFCLTISLIVTITWTVSVFFALQSQTP